MENNSSLKETFKSSDTEEFLDIYFYRPFGYIMAVAASKLNITPNAITYFSILVGVTAGHLLFYEEMILNIGGVLLLIWAEALDSTDGQLARIRNMKSRYGRILDGFAGNLWFLSIYIHLCLRMIVYYDYSPWVFLIAVIAGVSHSFQSAYADYFRNFYLFFVHGKNNSEIDNSEKLQKEYDEMKWSNQPFKKFLMRIYVNYTVEQELFAKNTIELYKNSKSKFAEKIDDKFSQKYRKIFKPLIKYFNILTTNTRLIILFISVSSGYYMFYFYFELTVLNLLLVYTIYKHEKQSKELLNSLKSA